MVCKSRKEALRKRNELKEKMGWKDNSPQPIPEKKPEEKK